MEEIQGQIERANQKFAELHREMAKTIVGQKRLIDRLLIALLAEGHVLLEGVPGIAKTLTVNTLAKTLDLQCKRIQFTPDLLPSDLIGTPIYNAKEGTFSIQKGPLFTNIVLADEINRAPPKVQSALLEVMQEKQVTIGGETLKTGSPFLVLATQNPIEHEGTYPLPEAETDRFMMKVLLDYPNREEEKEIIARFGQNKKTVAPSPVMTGDEIIKLQGLLDNIYLDDKIVQYIINIIFATRFPKESKANIHKLLEYGASPRASIYLARTAKAHALLEGRSYVTPYDVKEVAFDVLRHRLMLSYEAEAEEVTADMIIQRIFEIIPVP
ncbi:MAG: yeaC [Chlamydiia bacterium]|nr:yeaC [Chlamydiia bacterium]